jgi:hypothetical protein
LVERDGDGRLSLNFAHFPPIATFCFKRLILLKRREHHPFVLEKACPCMVAQAIDIGQFARPSCGPVQGASPQKFLSPTGALLARR